MSSKAHRAEMRRKYGPDWWKAKKTVRRLDRWAEKPAFGMTAAERKTYRRRRESGWAEDRAIKMVETERAAAKDAASYEKKWAGFPRLAGGMEDSSLLDPKYGYSVYKGALVYSDMDQAGASGWGIDVKKKGSKYTITGSGQEPYQGGDSYETLLSGVSRTEAIRYLRGLKDYYGPSEEP